MDKERFLRIRFIDNDELIVDVNDHYYIWEKILTQKNKILSVETTEWSWNISNNEIKFNY